MEYFIQIVEANIHSILVVNFMPRKLLTSEEIYFTLMEFNDYKLIKIFLIVKRKLE